MPDCQICKLQGGRPSAHWAWHNYCRAELNPVALLSRLDAMSVRPEADDVLCIRDYIIAATGMDAEGARRAVKAEMGT